MKNVFRLLFCCSMLFVANHATAQAKKKIVSKKISKPIKVQRTSTKRSSTVKIIDNSIKVKIDRKSTRLNSSHRNTSRMPSSA